MKKQICGGILGLALLVGGTCFGQNVPAAQNDLYAVEPQPLTVAQCGQCHSSIFRDLKENGGRHRFRCQRCHERFHAYDPVRNNWAELMPKCGRCHDKPHGAKLTNCLQCHTNPHTPRQVAMNSILKSACGQCHSQPAAELAKFPSAHTKQGCTGCHQKHGQIPSCLDCHEPHVAQQTVKACLGCHSPHKPLQVTYGANADSATCGSCHGDVYAKWRHTASKHGQVNCAQCHTRHGFIPKCTSCHGRPHDANMLKKFKTCLECHIDVHNLPVKKKTEGQQLTVSDQQAAGNVQPVAVSGSKRKAAGKR